LHIFINLLVNILNKNQVAAAKIL